MRKPIVYLNVMALIFFQACDNEPKKNIEKVSDSAEIKKVYSKKDTNGSVQDSLVRYQGSWYWKSKDSSSTFKLVLLLKADTVYGKYCAAYDFGNRMDCDFDTTNFNLRGTLYQDSVIVKFNSFYGAENGIAFIEKEGDSLLWKILKYPQGGDCYAPQEAVMYKKIKNW